MNDDVLYAKTDYFSYFKMDGFYTFSKNGMEIFLKYLITPRNAISNATLFNKNNEKGANHFLQYIFR